MSVQQITILQNIFTILITIPSAGCLLFLMLQLSKSCVRASTQLNVHCWAWILYFASGSINAIYVLIRWRGEHADNEPVFRLTIVLHLVFVFLLPLAVLVATVDRCISLRYPTYYALFNGETMRIITVVSCSSLIFVTFLWIFQIVVKIDGSCYLVECPEVYAFIHKFILYKAVFGFINLIVTSVFVYLFLNYQRRGRGLDKIRNTMIFVVLVAEFLFNVLPPLIWFFLETFAQMEVTKIFAPLVFTCINLDGLCTVLVLISTYKRKQKQFHQCKPRQPFYAHRNPFKTNRSSAESISHTGNFRINNMPPPFTRALTR